MKVQIIGANNIYLKGDNNQNHGFRDSTEVCGVCGGIANYFDVDPTVIRLAWVIFTLAGGSGLIAYIIAAIIMPEDPGYIDMQIGLQ